jgi:hypothetical protein
VLFLRSHGRFAAVAEECEEVTMKDQTQDSNQNHAADADVHASELHPARTAIIAPIFNIVAAAAWRPPHFRLLERKLKA